MWNMCSVGVRRKVLGPTASSNNSTILKALPNKALELGWQDGLAGHLLRSMEKEQKKWK